MKKIFKIFYLLFSGIIIFFITKPVLGQEYLSDKTETVYNNSNGLPTGKANSICQTSDGYIWIAQYQGLTQYNSKVFKTITKINDYDLTEVMCLETKNDELYIGTKKSLFIKKGNKYTKISLENDTPYCVNNIGIGKNEIYLATSIGLYSLNLNSLESNLLIKESIDEICVSDYNAYYILDKKLYTLDGQVNEFKDINVTSIYYKNNTLFVGTEEGFYIDNTKTFIKSLANSMNINSYLLDKTILYLACDDGLYIFNTENNELKKANNLSLSNSIEKVIMDYENNIWLASSKKGVSKITPNLLTDYFFEYDINSYFSEEKSVNSFIKYKNLDYIATDTGLIIIDASKPQDEAFINNELTESLDGVRLRSLAIFNEKLYIATYRSNTYDLIEYDGNTINNIDLSDQTPNNEYSTDVRCLYQTPDYLLIGTKQMELIKYDGNNFTKFKLEAEPLYTYYANNYIYVVLENIGPIKIDLNFNDETKIKKLNDIYSTLKVLYINNSLLFNDNNKLYVLKNDQVNLLDYDFEGSIVEILHLNDKFYIGTDTKIYEIDDVFNNSKANIIDISDGLKGNLVANSSGYYDRATNSYYFVANNGVYKYNLNHSTYEQHTPKIILSKIVENGNIIDSSDELILNKNVKRITFNFDVLTYSVSPKYEVFYKLDGVDNDYRILTEDDTNEISYTNLSGGDYKFHLFVKANDKFSNEIVLNVNKPKRFYEQIGFWIVVVILSLLTIGFFNFLFIKHKEKLALKKEIEYKEITLESIEAIARTIDAKDHYTNGHSLRVGYYAKEIAQGLGLDKKQVETVYYAGLLHDIGKIAVPDKILNKAGKLDEEEFCVMKSHTTEGAKILSSITTIYGINLGAKYHHERYDGKGYPEGLAGEDIPLIARIICCADCYDAMSSKRVYKESYITDHIISEFIKCSGKQFDPKIVPVVINLINENILTPYIDTSIEGIRELNLKTINELKTKNK